MRGGGCSLKQIPRCGRAAASCYSPTQEAGRFLLLLSYGDARRLFSSLFQSNPLFLEVLHAFQRKVQWWLSWCHSLRTGQMCHRPLHTPLHY